MNAHGGDRVKGGYYLNKAEWEITTVQNDGDALPGKPTDEYVRVPALMLVGLAPVMGGLYVMFLPFLGFAMLTGFLGFKAYRAAEWTASEVASVLAPSWQPGVAFFAGKRRKEAEKAPKAPEEKKEEQGGRLDALMQEIDEKRKNEPRSPEA